MKTYKLKTNSKKLLADTFTPVSVYLKIRDKYPNSLLLESSDYHANDNSFSFICFNPIAHFSVENNIIIKQYPDHSIVKTNIQDKNVMDELSQFSKQFEIETDSYKFINNGLFGYISYDAVQYFEKITIKEKSIENVQLD